MAEQHFDQRLGATIPENYQRFFVPLIGEPLAEDLLREARLKPDDWVLDIGCGTGVVTRLAAGRVAGRGRIVGLDINPGMLAVASSVTPPELGIEWYEGSAEAIPLPDETFTVVLCQLSLQFVGDRPRALREMYRVLTSGGRLLLNVPGPADPLFEILAKAMREHVSAQAAGFVQAVFGLHDEAELRLLLESAGFAEIAVQAETRELSLPGAKEFLWQYIDSTPLAGLVAQASPEARTALEHDVVGGWGRYEDETGLPYRQRVVTVSGRR